MYASVKQLGITQFLVREAIPLSLSLVLAELFYKFHSFTLEALAFLLTWYVLSAITAKLMYRNNA